MKRGKFQPDRKPDRIPSQISLPFRSVCECVWVELVGTLKLEGKRVDWNDFLNCTACEKPSAAVPNRGRPLFVLLENVRESKQQQKSSSSNTPTHTHTYRRTEESGEDEKTHRVADIHVGLSNTPVRVSGFYSIYIQILSIYSANKKGTLSEWPMLSALPGSSNSGVPFFSVLSHRCRIVIIGTHTYIQSEHGNEKRWKQQQQR